MKNELELEIVTPSGQVFTGSVNSCTVPGAEGQFQVLKGHTDYLSVIKIGALRVEQENKKYLNLATSGGFCEVKNNKIKIIVETAELSEKIDVHRAEEAKKRAEERLSSRQVGNDNYRAELALYRAVNRLKIAQLT